MRVYILCCLLSCAFVHEAICGQSLLKPLVRGLSEADEPSSETVTLVSRYIPEGNYTTATYSFRFMTRDDPEQLTYNNWELLYEGGDGRSEYFDVNTVVDDFSSIVDLGEMKCADIKSPYPEERERRPLVWLGYSNVNEAMRQSHSRTAPIRVGHCYVTLNLDSHGTVVGLFHVRSHDEGHSVTLDEVERLFFKDFR